MDRRRIAGSVIRCYICAVYNVIICVRVGFTFSFLYNAVTQQVEFYLYIYKIVPGVPVPASRRGGSPLLVLAASRFCGLPFSFEPTWKFRTNCARTSNILKKLNT